MASIEWRGKNRSSCRIIVSRPKVLGKGYDRFTKSVEFTSTMTDKQKEKEANRVAALFESKVLDNKYLDGNKITLAEYEKIWWRDYAVKELALSTQVHYRMRLDSRVLPALGHFTIARIQPHHLTMFFNILTAH